MLCGNSGSESVRSSECDVARLNASGHVMCLCSRINDLVNCLHSEVECHKLALARSASVNVGENTSLLTTGCNPAKAAPTVRPQNPASVIGLSITLFGPNRSKRPLVTLYLLGVSSSVGWFRRLEQHDQTTNAPLYCATSSPKMNTLSSLSNSSASASLRASRTVYSLPAGVA